MQINNHAVIVINGHLGEYEIKGIIKDNPAGFGKDLLVVRGIQPPHSVFNIFEGDSKIINIFDIPEAKTKVL